MVARNQTPSEDTPGSPEAVARGCTCDPVKNNGGKGAFDVGFGIYAHFPDKDCPLHGLDTLRDRD